MRILSGKAREEDVRTFIEETAGLRNPIMCESPGGASGGSGAFEPHNQKEPVSVIEFIPPSSVVSFDRSSSDLSIALAAELLSAI